MEELKTENDPVIEMMIKKYWEIINSEFRKELDEDDLDVMSCCKELYAIGRYDIDHIRGISFGKFEEEISPDVITDVYGYTYISVPPLLKKYVVIFEKEYDRLKRKLQSFRTISDSLCAMKKSI